MNNFCNHRMLCFFHGGRCSPWKKVFFLMIFFLVGKNIFSMQTNIDKKVIFERVDLGRFQEEVSEYSKKIGREKRALFFRRGAVLGVGAVVGVLGAAGIVAGLSVQNIGTDSAMEGGTLEDTAVENRPVQTWKVIPHSRGATKTAIDLFRSGIVYSFTASLGALFFDAIKNFSGHVKSKWWNKKESSQLLALSVRVRSTFLRFQNAVLEISKQKKDSFLYNHYLFEIVDSFSVLVRSLETCSAMLLCQLRCKQGKDSVVVTDYKNFIERNFLFLNYLAQKLEYDLNNDEKSERGVFSAESLELVRHSWEMISSSEMMPLDANFMEIFPQQSRKVTPSMKSMGGGS